MLDTGAYTEMSKIIHNFQQKNFIQKKGAYRVGICLALSGPSIWYGRMQPYLNEIELHEHYYIQGPQGCEGEAIQLCAVIGNHCQIHSWACVWTIVTPLSGMEG